MTKLIKKSWGYYSFILAMHGLFLGLILMEIKGNHTIVGLTILAYTLGLRHAFDADHIAAIDNTVRKLVHQDKAPMGTGFYFSLGHSTVVLLMSILIAVSVKWASQKLPFFERTGSIVGTIVSGGFLIGIAIFNLVVLINLLKRMRQKNSDTKLLPTVNGPLTFIFSSVFKFVEHAWQMYFVGLLFGLGFDTATEIALLTLSTNAATANTNFLSVLVLPISFAAGMCLMDTTDSVMMSGAYRWAFSSEHSKLYYNLIVTTVSVLSALMIGLTELIHFLPDKLKTSISILNVLQNIDYSSFGYILVGTFIVLWLLAYVITKRVQTAKLN